MKKITLFSLCFFTFWVCTVRVHATTISYKNFDNLVTEASAIVEGTVENIESYYDEDHEIYTLVTFKELDILSGK